MGCVCTAGLIGHYMRHTHTENLKIDIQKGKSIVKEKRKHTGGRSGHHRDGGPCDACTWYPDVVSKFFSLLSLPELL